jgi:hypothetical protein
MQQKKIAAKKSKIKSFTQNNKLTIFAFVVSLLFLVLGLQACSKINESLGLQDDNFIEELAEDQFEDYSGIGIDVTPSTAEF